MSDPTYTVRHVQRLLHMGKTATYEVIKAADFPSPVLVGKAYLWTRAEVMTWFEGQPRGVKTPRLRTARVESAALAPAGPTAHTVPYQPRRRGRAA